MTRVRTRGFTLIELLTASALLTLFIALATTEILHLTRASRSVARGSGELLATRRFAEHFRDDVRQARGVEIRANGQAVVLAVADGTIEYRVSSDSRLERVVSASGDSSVGPSVDAVEYSVNDREPRSRTLLHARWDCLAEIDPQQDKADPARPSPRVLILDTALRTEFHAESHK